MEGKLIKKEQVGYLKSKMMLLAGVLTMTETHLILDAHKTGTSGLGVLGAILKRKVESKTFGFKVLFSDITSVSQGKHGVNKNVLVIELIGHIEYRIAVKDYSKWSLLLNGDDLLND